MRSPAEPHAAGGLWVVIPVKPLHLSKQRLKDCLGERRPGLALAMLRDVLNALRQAATASGVLIVTRDPAVTRLALSQGARVEREAGPVDMNRAIAQGIAAARQFGANRVVVVPGDIPLLSGGAFDRLVNELQARSATTPGRVMGVVPAAGSGGTNWLCIEPTFPFTPMYGPDSYRKHCRQAQSKGARVVTLVAPEVSLDIDEETDVEAFLAICRSRPELRSLGTWQFLAGGEAATVHADRQHRARENPNHECSSS